MIVKNIQYTEKDIKKSNLTKPKTIGLEDQYRIYIKKKLKESEYYYLKGNVLYIDSTKKRKVLEEEIAYLKHKLQILHLASISVTGIRPRSANTYHRTKYKLKLYEKELESCTIGKIKYIDYPTFKSIIKTHNEKLQDYLLQGFRFKLTSNLGYLEMRVVQRNFKNKRIDFGATKREKNKLLAQGVKEEELKSSLNPEGTVNYIRYFTSDSYPVLAFKSANKVRNISVYTFKPSGGQPGKGFKNLIQKTVKEKPFLLSLYPVFGKKLN